VHWINAESLAPNINTDRDKNDFLTSKFRTFKAFGEKRFNKLQLFTIQRVFHSLFSIFLNFFGMSINEET
jgi:hypothetical protein